MRRRRLAASHASVVALFLLVGAPPRARADDSPMAFVALKDHEIGDLALTPEGDVLAGTEAGVWLVAHDGSAATRLPSDGLPAPIEKCPVLRLACTTKGDVFGIPGRGADGVYRLRALTARWEPVGKQALFLGLPHEVALTLAVLPDDTVLVSMANPSIYRGETAAGRLYRSRDGGETWSHLTPTGVGGASIAAMVPGTGRELWAVGGPRLSNTADPTRWVLVADDVRAATPNWKVSAIARSPKSGAAVGEPSIGAVSVDPRGVAYALVPSALSVPPGIYRSTDRGETWQRVNDAQEVNAVLTTPDAHAYVGSYGGVIRSLDGGTTWNGFAALGKTFVSSLLLDRAGHLWAGTTSHGQLFPVPGLFRSRTPVGTGTKPGPGSDGDVAAPTGPGGAGAGSGAGGAGGASAGASVLFDSGNVFAVENGPRVPTVVPLDRRTVVTRITTYHWNAGRGASPGTIALRGADGTVYGPWAAKGVAGQGRVSNVYWVSEPSVRLEPGTYTVVDSDPSTWAQNARSGGRGMVVVEGRPDAR